MLKNKRGSITPALMIIVGAFSIVIYGLLFVLTSQLDFSNRQIAGEEALSIAEAGINYYRWHLAHAPTDFKDGQTSLGPYEHDYTDPQGTKIGKFSLNIIAPINGSAIVTIESTGWSLRFPTVKRKIKAQYGKASLARYSFLQNASAWYGSGITVNGDIHSNTGIRMDGINTAKVTSAVATYTCGTETGCSPATNRPGVWGAGPNSYLWQFPIPSVDFNAISFDFQNMKTAAQSSGLYLGPSGQRGYHLIFSSNGTFQVRRVTNTSNYTSYTPEDGCLNRAENISSETNIGTYNVSNVPIFFAEDQLWVEGVVKGKISVVSARFPIDNYSMDIWVPNNLNYVAYDHTNNLGLIAQGDIYFGRNIPTNFRIDGALMAQKGKIIRHGYISGCGSGSWSVKNSLTINGSLISYNKSYWNFGSPPSSGFTTRNINYDADLLFMPPPYFPTSGEYEFISWAEE